MAYKDKIEHALHFRINFNIYLFTEIKDRTAKKR